MRLGDRRYKEDTIRKIFLIAVIACLSLAGCDGLFDDKPDADKDLWNRIRTGFSMDRSHPAVQKYLRPYVANQAYIDELSQRARPFLYFIVTETEKRGIPLEVVLLPIVESEFKAFAYSHGQAAGLWQFVPSTGLAYGLKQNWWYDGRRDVWASTLAALKYLDRLYGQFDDWPLALAAYNSGAGTVRNAMRRNRRRGKDTDFWSIRSILPAETRSYVPKLMAISTIIANPKQYGLTLSSIANEPYLARVEIHDQVDLKVAAELAELHMEDFYALNPAFNRWATEPDNASALLVPLQIKERFQQRLAALPTEQRTQWERHRVRKGETIGEIAAQYDTTAKVIKNVNKLQNNNIRQGHHLIIPVALKDASRYDSSILVTPPPKRIKRWIRYKVRRGDSLSRIAVKFHVSIKQIRKWNKTLRRKKYLHSGQRLRLYINVTDQSV